MESLSQDMYVNRDSCARQAMLTSSSQVAVLAQCTTIYLAISRFRMASSPEDYVVTDYENWMEVGLPVL